MALNDELEDVFRGWSPLSESERKLRAPRSWAKTTYLALQATLHCSIRSTMGCPTGHSSGRRDVRAIRRESFHFECSRDGGTPAIADPNQGLELRTGSSISVLVSIVPRGS
jgi:hypothetical protein